MKTRFPSLPASRASAPSAVATAERAVATPVTRGQWAALAGVLAVFVALSLFRIDRPGLNYDEAFAASTALKILHPAAPLDLQYGRGWDWRVFFLPGRLSGCRGDLQALWMALLFAVAPVGAVTMRAGSVLLGAGGIFLTFWVGRRLLSPAAGLLAAAMLAADPTAVMLMRNDVHFSTFDLLLRLACLVVVARLWNGSSWRREGWKLAGLTLLGVWSSLEFAWFVAGAATAMAVVGRSRVRRELAGRGWLVWGVLPLALWGVFFLFVTFVTQDPWIVDMGRRLARVVVEVRVDEALKRLRLIGSTFNGNFVETYYLGRSLPDLWHPLFELFAAATGVFLLDRWRQPGPFGAQTHARPFFLLCLASFTLVWVALTPPVYGAHHVWVVYPFLHLFAAGVFWEKFRASGRGVRAALAGLVAVYFAGAAHHLAGFERRLAAGDAHFAWAGEISEVAADLAARGRPVVCLDWGLGHNLAVLTGGRVPIQEPYRDPASGFPRGVEDPWSRFEDPAALYLLHTDEFSFNRPARGVFFALAAQRGASLRRLRAFDRRGRPAYELYEAVPAPAVSPPPENFR